MVIGEFWIDACFEANETVSTLHHVIGHWDWSSLMSHCILLPSI